MNKPVTETKPIEERIEGSINKDQMALTEISQSVGGLAFKDMGQVMEFSKLMSVAKQAVPAHLRGQPGACMAVSLQALNWRMDPFAVANKSYMVNDRIAYEAQLIHAVIEQRAPINGRLKGKYIGEGATRQCVLSCISAEDGETIEYVSPEIGSITTKNSPLWKSDPDQQLWYYSARAMCRRHFPDVLLGVYEKEEIANAPTIKDVTPKTGGFAAMAQQARGTDEPDEQPEEAKFEDLGDAEQSGADETTAVDGEILPPQTDQEPEFDNQKVDPFADEYTEGVKARQAGMKPEMNPFKTDDPSFNYDHWNNWIGGYRFAEKQEKKGEES